MTEPWIGNPATESPGTCTYAIGPGHPRCGEPATVHILSESAVDGPISLPACDLHAPVARRAGIYMAEHPHGPACAGPKTWWKDDGCAPVKQDPQPEPLAAEVPLDDWILGREAWIADGIIKGYASSDVRCATHDGEPLTPAEELIFEDGVDDPCIPIIRLASEPGERFIPRFGS